MIINGKEVATLDYSERNNYWEETGYSAQSERIKWDGKTVYEKLDEIEMQLKCIRAKRVCNIRAIAKRMREDD